ncbi:unnamed protein product [Caenorhabditis brenneri]
MNSSLQTNPVREKIAPQDHFYKESVPVVKPFEGKIVKAEVVKDHGEQPIVEDQMELEDDFEMMEVTNILVDKARKMQGKKKRKTYAATYRKRKAAEKSYEGRIRGKQIKMEIDPVADHF